MKVSESESGSANRQIDPESDDVLALAERFGLAVCEVRDAMQPDGTDELRIVEILKAYQHGTS